MKLGLYLRRMGPGIDARDGRRVRARAEGPDDDLWWTT
jgi:hypothetical protein